MPSLPDNIHEHVLFPHGLTPMQEFDTPAETAMYFGFTPIKTPCVSRKDRSVSQHLQAMERSSFLCAPEEKTSLLRMYQSNGLDAQRNPTMLFYQRPGNVSSVRSDGGRHFGLDIIGSDQSVADALAIHTACCILTEEGFDPLVVDINSIGDRDSLERFERTLLQFYRARINDLPTKYREMLKDNVFDLLQASDRTMQEINVDAPRAINFLSESDRRHFMDVLEHLDDLGIPFRISNTVVGNSKISSKTVFCIRHATSEHTGEALAMGTRYNRLARRVRLGKDISAVGVSLAYPAKRKRRIRKTPLQPKFFFCHLGDVARRRSLGLINELRRSKIPVYHSLVRNKIRSQLEYAEHMKLPHVIIMGQKEAVEDAVVIRDMKTREQETIPTSHLITYLKKTQRRSR